MQERRNSTADALELRLSCTNPSIYHWDMKLLFSVYEPSVMWMELPWSSHNAMDSLPPGLGIVPYWDSESVNLCPQHVSPARSLSLAWLSHTQG